MIPFDFDYYKPDTLNEAYNCFWNLKNSGKSPVYFSGGTELISMAQSGSITFNSVIDLKGIPECNQLCINSGRFIIGSCQTLSKIAGFRIFPLLTETVKRIADHTIQEKITLGGNLAGTVKYREGALPLMLCDCNIKIMTSDGIIEKSFLEVFDGRLNFSGGAFMISVSIAEENITLPYNHAKRTKMDKIDYPLITIAAIKNKDIIKAAITGYGDYPMLLPSDLLNNNTLNENDRGSAVVSRVSPKAVSDLSGSREYKDFVLKNMLLQTFQNFSC